MELVLVRIVHERSITHTHMHTRSHTHTHARVTRVESHSLEFDARRFVYSHEKCVGRVHLRHEGVESVFRQDLAHAGPVAPVVI